MEGRRIKTKYEVTITETFHHTLTVEAESESAAEKAAIKKLKSQLQSFGRAEAGDLTVTQPESYPIEQILRAAASLFDPTAPSGPTEYRRGVCELIGRLRLDFGNIGDGTGENALEVQDEIERRIMS